MLLSLLGGGVSKALNQYSYSQIECYQRHINSKVKLDHHIMTSTPSNHAHFLYMCQGDQIDDVSGHESAFV